MENIKGNLSDAEWQELVTLDYVLTWRYSENEKKDLARQKELRYKRTHSFYD